MKQVLGRRLGNWRFTRDALGTQYTGREGSRIEQREKVSCGGVLVGPQWCYRLLGAELSLSHCPKLG